MLIFDERTCCMKPDLHVSIIVDAIDFGDKSKPETKNLMLRRGGEIPEEDLPEPFNRSKQNMRLNMIKGPISLSSNESTDTLTERQSLTAQSERLETLAGAVNDQQPVVASHISRSFRKRFSQKATSKAQEVVQECSKVSLKSSNFQVPEQCADRSVYSDETSSTPTQSPTKCLSKATTSETSSKTCLPAIPVKEINPLKTEGDSLTKAGRIHFTPAKLASTPARLMTATPTLQPQKRCYMSPDEVSSSLSNKLVRRPPPTRSLKFDTLVKEEKVVDEVHEMAGKPVNNDEDDVLSILPVNLLHSIRSECHPF
ncbi:hypothetical protein REPUB_Repub12eG0104800 [Reevesia pubescens]